MLFAPKTVKQVNDKSTIIVMSVYLTQSSSSDPTFGLMFHAHVYIKIYPILFSRIKNEVILPIEVKLYPSKTKVLLISPSTSSAFAVTKVLL